jgi:hypothetical protein
MALSVVQAASASSSGSNTTATFGATTTAGSLIVVISYQGVDNTTNLVVSDSASQTGWTQVGSYVTVSGDRFAMFYRPNSAAITNVKCTWGSLNATIPVVAYEIAGAATSSPLDANASNPATSTQTNGTHNSFASGTLSTNNANDILLFAMGASVNVVGEAAGTGYTAPTNWNASNGRCAMQYKIVSATQSSVSTSISFNSVAVQNVGIFAAFSDTNQAVTFQPDEDFWDELALGSSLRLSIANPFSAIPVSTVFAMGEDLAGPLFGQPDEDYWSVFVVQPTIPVVTIFS